ncbi:PKD domain-containing protein [Cellulomonas sp. CW35]|uniref:PKD domain-containing protein n=1 Tax=Cellulomonas sp. CW35 TaxID=3458249 RepID=UPI004034E9B7
MIGEEDGVDASAFQREHERRLEEARPVSQRKFRYQRTGECQAPAGSQHLCPSPIPPPGLACEDGPPLAPLWRQALEGDNQWYRLGDWVCPEDLQPPLTGEDLRRLKVEPVRVRHQPASGPMLITKPVIVYAEPNEQRFDVRLLDFYDVEVLVTPAEYAWDFGDGGSLTSVVPGRPYPAFDLTHVYGELGRARITLHTTWAARYRVATDPAHRWRDADGTVQTVDEGEPFEVIELRSTLVD